MFYNTSSQKIAKMFWRLIRADTNSTIELKKSKNIWVVDFSGSMGEHIKILKDKLRKLEKDGDIVIVFACRAGYGVDYNAGVYTNIIAGVQLLVKKIKELEKDGVANANVTLISDGGDGGEFEKSRERLFRDFKTNMIIEFRCIGVGSGFPAHLTNSVKSIFHTANSAINSVFLVQSNTEWNNEFERFEKLLSPKASLKLPNGKVVYEGELFKYDGEFSSLNSDWIAEPADLLDKSHLLEIFTLLKNDVQTFDLDKKNNKDSVIEYAKKTLEVMELLLFLKDKKIKSVQKFMMNKSNELGQFVEEVRNIAKGQSLRDLSDKDLADRQAIGTKTTKYTHKLANKFGGKFDIPRAILEFKELLREFQNNVYESKMERSEISLESIYDILMDPDLSLALDKVESVYDLVKLFSFIGTPVKFGYLSQIEPWSTTIVDYWKTIKTIDSAANSSGEIAPIAPETTSASSVLLFVTSDDSPMIPLLKSKLFQALFTFQATEQVDEPIWYAHASMLCSFFIHLAKNEKPTSLDKEYMQKCIKTFQLLYEKMYGNYIEAFKEEGDFKVLMTDSGDKGIKCESISKFIFFFYMYGPTLSQSRKMELIKHMWIEIFYDSYTKQQKKISDLFTGELMLIKEVEENGTKTIIKTNAKECASNISIPINNYGNFYDKSELVEYITDKIPELISKCKFDIELKFNSAVLMAFKNFGSINSRVMYKLQTRLGIAKEFNPFNDLLVELLHSNRYSNSKDRHSKPLDEENLKRVSMQILNDEHQKFQEQLSKMVLQKHLKNYRNYFISTHNSPVIPFTPEMKLPEGCILRKSAAPGLASNMCMQPGCCYYLVPRSDYEKHRKEEKSTEFWMDSFHKTIWLMRNENIEDIYAAMLNQKYIREKATAVLPSDEFKDPVKKMIESVLDVYKQFPQ